MVLGTEDATPLTFWVAVAPQAYLQLDDAVVVDTEVPGRGPLRIAGIVQEVRARHEGASFDTDVFLVDRGVLPVETAVAAQVVATRFEPEIFVPPRPGAGAAVAHVEGRSEGVAAYYWTVRECVREKYLRFMFAEAEDERSQIADLVARVESYLDRDCEDDPEHQATVVFGGYPVKDFDGLCELIKQSVEDEHSPWRGRLSDATVA